MFKDDKYTKVPIDPKTGAKAAVNHPPTWGTLDHALARAARFNLAGIGFVFTEGDRFFGSDLDDAVDPATGALTPAAVALLERFATYAEWSPTQRGIHVIGTTDHSPHAATGNKRGPIECYWRGRFFTVTGAPLQGHGAIANCTDELLTWRRETFGTPPPASSTPRPTEPAPGDDTALLARAFAAKNGHKVRRLFDGDISAHGGDDSAADLALVSSLCFRTADDDQVDRLFRPSGLFRQKWERADYRQRTLAKARARQPGPASDEGAPPEPAVASPSVEAIRRGPNGRTCHNNNNYRPYGQPLAPDAAARGAAARTDLLAREERRSDHGAADAELPPGMPILLPLIPTDPPPMDQWMP